MYAVNQGPAYTDPVVNAEPTPAYDEGYGYRRAPRYYGDGGYRIRRHWGYRHGYGQRFGYGHRFGMKRYRYGAAGYGRYSMRHPIAGPGSVFRGPRHSIRHGGMHRAHHQMGNRMHMMHRTPGTHRAPGVVHPKMP